MEIDGKERTSVGSAEPATTVIGINTEIQDQMTAKSKEIGIIIEIMTETEITAIIMMIEELKEMNLEELSGMDISSPMTINDIRRNTSRGIPVKNIPARSIQTGNLMNLDTETATEKEMYIHQEETIGQILMIPQIVKGNAVRTRLQLFKCTKLRKWSEKNNLNPMPKYQRK